MRISCRSSTSFRRTSPISSPRARSLSAPPRRSRSFWKTRWTPERAPSCLSSAPEGGTISASRTTASAWRRRTRACAFCATRRASSRTSAGSRPSARSAFAAKLSRRSAPFRASRSQRAAAARPWACAWRWRPGRSSPWRRPAARRERRSPCAIFSTIPPRGRSSSARTGARAPRACRARCERRSAVRT